jgi:hypothetical protein
MEQQFFERANWPDSGGAPKKRNDNLFRLIALH